MPTATDAEWPINSHDTYHWALYNAIITFVSVVVINAWQRLQLRHLLASFSASVVGLHGGSVGHATGFLRRENTVRLLALSGRMFVIF